VLILSIKFACSEGIIPALESGHAIYGAVLQALQTWEDGREKPSCSIFPAIAIST